jgi:hypothetical protein
LNSFILSFQQDRRVRFGAICLSVVYLAGVSAFLLRQGAWPTPDFLIPPLVLLAVFLGRGWSFVIDWAPFLLLILTYEAFRGFADDLNARVHMEELVDAERWITAGRIPTISLQERFFDPENIAWYDWLSAALHASHFGVPVAFGLVIWLASRTQYWRYATSVVLLSFAGFLSHYLYPAAPPWMAANAGLIPPVERILGYTLSRISTGDGLTLAYQNFSPNDVAALPSLHAAFPALIALIAFDRYRWRGLIVLPWVAAGSIAWVYLGEHYFIDVLAGWIYGVAAFGLVWLLGPRLIARLPKVHLSPSLRLRPLPNWPLAIAALTFIVLVWFNPLVKAPLQREEDAVADVAPAPAVCEAPFLPDLATGECLPPAPGP